MRTFAASSITLWIWLCAFLSCTGWGLSALHELNAKGYLVALGLGAAALFAVGMRIGMPARPCWRKVTRRFRRGLPLGFLMLAVLAFAGGAWYAPNNFDGLAYRLPRILNWLAAGRWHWIDTLFPRVNGRACGIEWVSTPLVAIFQTDRLLFLINFISFLLLPGLVYSVFTRLGVRRRVAWHWMWIAPTGYGFLLQAGSIGNDLFGAPFVLAAVDFALRAKVSGSQREFWTSVVAAALMTGAKTSNLPLLLPWAVAIWPSLKFFKRSWVPAAIVTGLVSLLASAAPTLVFNAHYYHGDWAGLSAEGDDKHGSVIIRTALNIVLATGQNLTPPVFPWASVWNHAVQRAIPAGLSAQMHQAVAEPPAAELKLDEMQIEEGAGAGLGVSLLLLLSVMAAIRQGGFRVLPAQFATRETRWQAWVRLLPLISLLALLSKSEVLPIARILTPYYALLMPFFLAGSAEKKIESRRWWQMAVALVFCVAGLVVVITPARPLIPIRAWIAALESRHPDSNALARAATVYSVYHERHEAFAPVLAQLPPTARVVGLFTYDDPETSLWLPFGSRRIVHIRPENTVDDLRAQDIQYLVFQPQNLQRWFKQAPETWVRGLNGTVVKVIPLRLRASGDPTDWWLVKLP